MLSQFQSPIEIDFCSGEGGGEIFFGNQIH